MTPQPDIKGRDIAVGKGLGSACVVKKQDNRQNEYETIFSEELKCETVNVHDKVNSVPVEEAYKAEKEPLSRLKNDKIKDILFSGCLNFILSFFLLLFSPWVALSSFALVVFCKF